MLRSRSPWHLFPATLLLSHLAHLVLVVCQPVQSLSPLDSLSNWISRVSPHGISPLRLALVSLSLSLTSPYSLGPILLALSLGPAFKALAAWSRSWHSLCRPFFFSWTSALTHLPPLPLSLALCARRRTRVSPYRAARTVLAGTLSYAPEGRQRTPAPKRRPEPDSALHSLRCTLHSAD
ncbi:hypothetical protein BGZ61DRAFT_112289 [Ilyonectria robusta]|uniref:uncharacterized protein n=1 Tax=Ilyonectria robusta TaxID=1079257 RepID=UPI001E8D105B|nr:uncharacterized protein BGZ61DRAFT_112289 [Ilyonectria robusta]KAH8669905.1 hypothetical protein BGZ61DRAFT_112289 [Ilyonectria robusta]